MKARTVTVLDCACPDCRKGSGGCRKYPDGKKPIGTILDGPNSWKLVRMGVAEPADDECKLAANMTPEQMKRAQHAQKKVSRGIHPNDYEAYDAGLMDGYYLDGTDRPGPNTTESEGGIILHDDEWDSDG